MSGVQGPRREATIGGKQKMIPRTRLNWLVRNTCEDLRVGGALHPEVEGAARGFVQHVAQVAATVKQVTSGGRGRTVKAADVALVLKQLGITPYHTNEVLLKRGSMRVKKVVKKKAAAKKKPALKKKPTLKKSALK